MVSTIKQSPIGFSGTLVEKPNFGFSENPRDMGFNYLTPGPFSINVRNPTAGTYIVAKARKLALG